MTSLDERVGRHLNGKRPPKGSTSEREGLRFAKYQRAKVRQEIQQERRATRQGWRLDTSEPLPFSRPGRPEDEAFGDGIGVQLPPAGESPDSELIQEIEDDVVRIWRNNALFFSLLAVVVGAIRTAVVLVEIEWLALWFLDVVTLVLALAGCASAVTGYFIRSVSDKVWERHHVERARINAVAARRTQQQSRSHQSDS